MRYLFILLSFFVISCSINRDLANFNRIETKGYTIAFGSCSDQDRKQILWDEVLYQAPNMWVWLGDNIYGDSEDMAVLKAKYNQQKSNPLYQKIIKQTLIEGVWDDHDFGVNDGGKDYPKKAESQQLLLDFLGVKEYDERRKREGVYYSKLINHNGLVIKFIALDARYFRDELKKVDGVNAPNLKGTILGEAQWKWLEKELKDSKAYVHIFASGIQAIAKDHRFEKWANYPQERDRLFDLIEQNHIQNPIIISGDRHIGEISQINWKGKTITDITSSSLTHGWSARREEYNQHRKGNIVYDQNYGLLDISLIRGRLEINAFLVSDGNLIQEKISLGGLGKAYKQSKTVGDAKKND